MRKLRKAWIWLVGCYASLLVLLPTIAEAKKALSHVVIVADTRKLSGIELWCTMITICISRSLPLSSFRLQDVYSVFWPTWS